MDDTAPFRECSVGPMASDTLQASGSRFASTRWTVVLLAKDKHAPGAAVALETLCRDYWYPLYAYARRQGSAPADAQDLTQGFFARFLEKEYLKSVSPEKGRFRSFLLVAFKRFAANEWARGRAEKRGGGEAVLSLDFAAAENLYQSGGGVHAPADLLYDQRWAVALLDRALIRLREEHADAPKNRLFDALKGFIAASKDEVNYAGIAEMLGMRPGTVRVAMHRLRQRYREIVHEEIAHTVSDPVEVESELKYLRSVLSA